MDALRKNESFFVEGTGRAVVADDNGKVGYIHLQNATFDFSSKMEDIFGGESNSSLYSFQSEKTGKVTFQNASMDAQTVALTQGVAATNKATLFEFDEIITIGADGSFTLKKPNVDVSTLIVSDLEGNVIPCNGLKVDAKFNGQKFYATYAYTADAGAVGVNVGTVSVPGYVTIFFKSKPMKQKNGRIIRQYITLYKARASGGLKLDYKHKNAFAPELEFNIVDPERPDGKFWSYSVRDVTDEEKNNRDVITPVPLPKDAGVVVNNNAAGQTGGQAQTGTQTVKGGVGVTGTGAQNQAGGANNASASVTAPAPAGNGSQTQVAGQPAGGKP